LKRQNSNSPQEAKMEVQSPRRKVNGPTTPVRRDVLELPEQKIHRAGWYSFFSLNHLSDLKSLNSRIEFKLFGSVSPIIAKKEISDVRK
jgi:hypothetical protein